MTLYEEFRFRDMKSRKVGREEGLAAGLEEGAKLTQIKNAKAMLADSMPVELVCKYTGLSAEQIENIKTDI